MQLLQGIAASPGVAIGEALVLSSEGFQIPRRFVVRDAVENGIEIDATNIDIDRGDVRGVNGAGFAVRSDATATIANSKARKTRVDLCNEAGLGLTLSNNDFDTFDTTCPF